MSVLHYIEVFLRAQCVSSGKGGRGRTYEVLKPVKGLDAFTLGLVLGRELLGLTDHTVNLLLAEMVLLVGDRDGLGLATVRASSQ